MHNGTPLYDFRRPAFDISTVTSLISDKKEPFAKVLAYTVLFFILSAPVTCMGLIILWVKPDGPLSIDQNTTFWFLASLGMGFAVVTGTSVLAWFIRQILRWQLSIYSEDTDNKFVEEILADPKTGAVSSSASESKA